jgi:N-acetylneuraminate synthase/N,N'-diacetyllegionaminate synthase
VDIGGRRVGPGAPVLVIAEAGVNHNGDLDLARRLVDAAADAGADIVKFQAFRADRVAAPHAPKAGYQLEATDPGESQRDMLRRLELSGEANAALRDHCAERGVVFLSSPFDTASADDLERLGVPAFKIGSGELTNHPFLEYVARKELPVILSTGMATLDEVRDAGAVIAAAGAPYAVLHCVSNYPSAAADSNLRAIPAMASALGVPVGWSDHTTGTETALAAVALGACILEKHLTLDRSLPGPDHAASFEPGELADLIAAVRTAEAALGDGVKRPAANELANREIVRRGLVLTRDLAAGETLAPELLDALRPGTGITPAQLGEVVGRRAARPLPAGHRLGWEDLA